MSDARSGGTPARNPPAIAAAEAGEAPFTRSTLMRRVYGWLATGVIAFAIYGSLLPFRLRDRAIDGALTDFINLLLDPRNDRASRTNLIANLLLFVPIGFALMGTRLADRARQAPVVRAALSVVLISVFVSLVAEFLQLFVRGRISSRLDILAQTAGCLIGVAGWMWAGPALTDWLRGRSHRTRADPLTRILVGYAALWLFVNLAPFDITVDVEHLGRRLRTGLITFVPFGSPAPTWRQAWDAVAAAASAIPIGMLALVGWADEDRRRRAWPAWALGAAAVFALEAMQIFIRSHAADVTDILFGWLGVALGVQVGIRAFTRTAAAAGSSPDGARPVALFLTFLWTLIVCGYHWQPFDFGIDVDLIRNKMASISLIPLAGYQSGSDLNALNNLIAKLSVAAPLGLFASFALPLRRFSKAALLAGWIAVSTVIFASVEIGQLFVPSRVPDPTDVLLGVAASLAGLWLGRWLRTR